MPLDAGVVVGLTIVGAGCELIGIGLVVKEIADDRALAREVVTSQEVAASFVKREKDVEWAGPISRALRIDWGEVTQVNKKEFRKTLDEAVSRLIEEDRERDQSVRQFLQKQLTGSIAGRLVGVGLFATGVTLAAIAQLIQVSG